LYRVDKLSAGEVVAIDIDMFPIGLAVHPGEQLRLTVSGHNALGGPMPNVPNVTPDNHGNHVIHIGGSRGSYLQLPVKAR
jgi:predicted acyl esterase